MPLPPQKDTITPPAPSSSPLHRHTGFIIAIALTSVLLVIAAVLAYLSWDNGLRLARENVQLLTAATTLQEQNQTLQTQLTEESNRPGPVPFYYFTSATPFITPAELHATDPVTGEDTVIFTMPDSALYEVIAQPRRWWTGAILIHKIIEGENISYIPFLFDVAAGAELTPAPVGPKLPFGITSVSLSPDERYFAAVYDSPEPTAARSLAFLDTITGVKYDVDTLAGYMRYASSYSDFGYLGDFSMRWIDSDCIRISRFDWTPGISDVTLIDTPLFCLSDYVR